MSKEIKIIFLGLAMLSVIAISGVGKAVLRFLIFGMVPGTDYILSPIAMMAIITVIIWVIAMHLTGQLSETLATSRQVKKYLSRQKRLPKRRYAR